MTSAKWDGLAYELRGVGLQFKENILHCHWFDWVIHNSDEWITQIVSLKVTNAPEFISAKPFGPWWTNNEYSEHSGCVSDNSLCLNVIFSNEIDGTIIPTATKHKLCFVTHWPLRCENSNYLLPGVKTKGPGNRALQKCNSRKDCIYIYMCNVYVALRFQLLIIFPGLSIRT